MAESTTNTGIFLTAEWRHLLMLNYEVDSNILLPYVPKGTTLDLWQGRAYVSIVGFMFLNTKLKGMPIPFHQNFEEVNLRFYVTHEGKRGVVFIKEIVPKSAIALIANMVYREHYVSKPMSHIIDQKGQHLQVKYSWQHAGEWLELEAMAQPNAVSIPEGSEAEFITEHYWGYSAPHPDKTIEYQVEHPRWEMFAVEEFNVSPGIADFYGEPFKPFLLQAPKSVFIALGSPIIVRDGHAL